MGYFKNFSSHGMGYISKFSIHPIPWDVILLKNVPWDGMGWDRTGWDCPIPRGALVWMILKGASSEVLTPGGGGVLLSRVYQFTSTSSKWNETFRACRTRTYKHSCRFEKIENLVKRSKWGGQGGTSQTNWTLSSSSITNARSLKILP